MTERRDATFSLGYPILLHWALLLVVLGLLLLAAVQGITLLLVLTLFLLALAGVAWYWSRSALRRLTLEVSMPQDRAFPDEKVELSFVLTNNKWLSLPWLDVEEDIPYRLATGVLSPPSPYNAERLHWAVSVSGGQRLRWRHQVLCRVRGDYRLGPVLLRSGDIFGFFPKEMVLPAFMPLLVYPRIVPVEKLSLPLKELVGERSIPLTLYEDLSRTVGVRDYHHGDPLKRIHWKASARRNQLQTRQYESTTSLSLFLIFDVGSFCRRGTEDLETFELAVTTVASLANETYRKGSPLGLLSDSAPEIHLGLSSGREQLMLVLEALARVQPKVSRPLAEVLAQGGTHLPAGATLAIVARGLSPAMNGALRRLQQENHAMLLVSVGEPVPANGFDSIPAISITSTADLSGSHVEAAT